MALPTDITDIGVKTPGFFVSKDEKETIKKSIVDGQQKNKYNELNKHMDGARSELEVLMFIQDSMKDLSATFWSYKQLATMRFIGKPERRKRDNKLVEWFTDQEYDIILLLPKYKKFVLFEVKSYKGAVQKKTLDPLIKGKDFFDTLQGYIVDNTWSTIQVVALPNVSHRGSFHNKQWREVTDLVLITADEMKQNLIDVLIKDGMLEESHDSFERPDEAYKKLVNVLYASAHAQDVRKSSGNVGLQTIRSYAYRNMDNPATKTHEKLFGDDKDVVTAGFHDGDLSLPEEVQFDDLKGKPLSDIRCLIFWNPSQYQVKKSVCQKQLISGEFGTGKTLLLMCIVQDLLDRNQKVAFLCDASNSSKMFDTRMKMFCEENGVVFQSIEISNDKANVEQFLTIQQGNHLVIDELDYSNFNLISSKTTELGFQHVTCVANPVDTLENVMELELPEGWKRTILTKVMRNTSRIYNAAVSKFPEVDRMKGVIPSTVVGQRPICILINYNDWYLGLATAFEIVKAEDKFVVLTDGEVESTVSDMLTVARPDMPMMLDVEEDRRRFLDKKTIKGCFISHMRAFNGMESKSLIIANKAYSIMVKDKVLRSTSQLGKQLCVLK